jgi:ribosomal protein L11 methyltransferase
MGSSPRFHEPSMPSATEQTHWVFYVTTDSEELLVAELWSHGTLGLESRADGTGVRVDAYFPASAEARLSGIDWGRFGAECRSATAVERTDWLEAYRRSAKPFDLGSGFRVDPGEAVWSEATAGGGRRLLRVPQRTAFGTGTHPSTRLAVMQLEADPPAGESVLDLGTGSGILAMVALHLGARRAVGLEIDPEAIWVALDTTRLNGLEALLVAGGAECLAPAAAFDRVVANMTFRNLVPCLGPLAAALPVGCSGVFSGLLAEQADAFDEQLRAVGFEPTGEARHEEEWIARTAVLGAR